MTRAQLDAIRARVEAATPGPWEAVTPKRYAAVRSDADRCYVYTQGKIPADTHPDTVARQQRDAQFIAAARQDVPALLAEVKRMQKIIDAVGEVISQNGEDCDCDCTTYGSPHGLDCDPCLACRVDDALGEKR